MMISYKSCKLISIVALTVSLLLFAGCSSQQPASYTPAEANREESQAIYQRSEEIALPEEALQLLLEGNTRYIEGKTLSKELGDDRRSALVTNGQKPFAVIVNCSDSRVPPELVFDQGLGDLFVIRTAGNIVDAVAIGSVEYGVGVLKAPLLVVLGHEECGAVKATIHGGEFPGSIGAVVEKIKEPVEAVMATNAQQADLVEKCIDENIKSVIAELKESPVISELINNGNLQILGAKYEMQTGEVVWFDE